MILIISTLVAVKHSSIYIYMLRCFTALDNYVIWTILSILNSVSAPIWTVRSILHRLQFLHGPYGPLLNLVTGYRHSPYNPGPLLYGPLNSLDLTTLEAPIWHMDLQDHVVQDSIYVIVM